MAVKQEKDKSKWTKDGRSWYFRVWYTNQYGAQKQKWSAMFFTKKEAKQAEAKFLTTSNSKKTSAKMTLNKLFDEYEIYLTGEKNKSSSNYADFLNYKNHIKDVLGETDIQKINLTTIRNWQKGLSDKTYTKKDSDGVPYQRPYGHEFKQKIHSLLSCILDYAVSMGYIEENMAYRIGNFKSPNDEVQIQEKKIRYQTPVQFNMFMSVVDILLWQVFFMFLYWTGARKGEVQALTWEDIDFDRDLIRINKTLTNKIKGGGWKITNTKNRKNRTILLMPQLKPLLLKWYQENRKHINFSTKWFIFGNTRFLANSTIDNYKDHYYDKINKTYPMEKLTTHEFGRHTHASLLISLGVSDISIAERLGDTVAVIRKTYAHLFPVYHDEILTKASEENINLLSEKMKKYI